MLAPEHKGDDDHAGSLGEFTLFEGPMGAGKTTIMMEHLRRIPIDMVLVFKYAGDTRYTNSPNAIVSHSGSKYEDMNIFSVGDLEIADKVVKEHPKCKYIGVDELQFMDGASVIKRWMLSGINILGAALKSTWEGKMFPKMADIYPLATCIKTIPAFCTYCQTTPENAFFTHRTTASKALELIGGEDMYHAICTRCAAKLAPLAHTDDAQPIAM
jgi:thymidine kinase